MNGKKNTLKDGSVEEIPLNQDNAGTHRKSPLKSHKVKIRRLVLALLITLALFFIVIVFLIVSNVNLAICKGAEEDLCSYSEEARKVGLKKVLDKVYKEYFEVLPAEILWHPQRTVNMMTNFRVYDPKAENIKRISEHAERLLKEVIDMKPDVSNLKPREHKAYLQAKHFLENTFGNPFLKYKSGLWLLGPTSFCYEHICLFGDYVSSSQPPTSKADIDDLIQLFKSINQSTYEYIDVLRMGIRRGMVRTRTECTAGAHALKTRHLSIDKNGPEGIKEEDYGKHFYKDSWYEGITKELNQLYLRQHGLNITNYVTNNLQEYVGKSIHWLLLYLQTEHYSHCRPDSIGAGGLSALPISVIYSNESVIPNSRTNPFLPLCSGSDCRLNGSEAYAMVLGYFTTKDIHPLEIHKLGWENVRRLYPQIIEIAKDVTNSSEESKGVDAFRAILNNLSLSYFHDTPLPSNENNAEAHAKCISDESAQKYCPNRWKAMMKWFKFAEMVMSMHDPNTVDFFYFTGERKSVPTCPIKLRADYNPAHGAQSYRHSNRECSNPSYYNIPFFLENLGPKYSEYSINAHEARPGHHTQGQGYTENFGDSCGGPAYWLDSITYYTAFTEGWALYAESPLIAQETSAYKGNPMQKYGMLKWQIFRALRMVVDTGLHYKGWSRARALQLFAQYAWDEGDVARKEVTRYQSNAGQSTAYMIGQLDIWSLRNRTQKKLQEHFSLKEFHFQTLSQGKSPLAFLESHINKYIECKLDTSKQHCDIVLSPRKKASTVKQSSNKYLASKARWRPMNQHYL